MIDLVEKKNPLYEVFSLQKIRKLWENWKYLLEKGRNR